MARITVGMPVYNGAATLGRAIAGLEAQSLGEFTVIAADNASTDGSHAMLEDWAARDDRVTVHRHGTNIGALGNFRFVLDRAKTDYFMWHACDDRLGTNYLERLCALLDGDTGCGLAVGDVVKHEAGGGEKRRIFPELAGRSRLGRVIALLGRPRAPWIYGLFRTAELRPANARAVEFGHLWGGDYVTLMPFILNDRIRGTGEAVFHYRMSDEARRTYRPGGAAHLRFFGRYLRYNLAILGESRLSTLEKTLCLPLLLRHVARGLK